MTDLEKLRVEVATADLSDDARRVMLGVIRVAERNREMKAEWDAHKADVVALRREARGILRKAERVKEEALFLMLASGAFSLFSIAVWLWTA